MNPNWPSSPGFGEFENLLRGAMDGPPETVDWSRLEAVLDEHPEAVVAYVELMAVHAMLQWRSGRPAGIPPMAHAAPMEDSQPMEHARDFENGEGAAPQPDSREQGAGSGEQEEGELLSFSQLPAPSSLLPALRRGGRIAARCYTAPHHMALSLLLVLAAVPLVWWVASRQPWASGRRTVVQGLTGVEQRTDVEHAAEGGKLISRSPAPSPSAVPVARLVRSYACVWSDADKPLADGDRLEAGKRIELRSGLAEISFDCGARVILQGPAALLPESARGGSLASGKITVRADGPAAKGFAIRTPAMKAVDLGTEFGLEVSPAGIEQVHVFQGQVEVATPCLLINKGEKGPSASPQLLVEKQGLEVNLNTKGVKLVANNGERFARSLDEAQNRRHVVAWWRFEDHPVGVLVPESQEGKAPVRGSLDSSINGNDLYCWSKGTQPTFSSDVPAAEIPLTGEPNAASLDNCAPPDSHPTRDLFTRSRWSGPSPVDLQTVTPAKWTVEASVKPAKLRADDQTFVVRDGMNVCAADPKLAPFALYVTPQKHFAITFCDVEGRAHTAACAALTVEENHWYHVAAVSDGEELKLYVDSLDGNGYGLRSIAGLPKTGSTALARSVWRADDPERRHRHIWSVGRGCYDGEVCRWFQGWIDEVRISDEALAPAELLFAKTKTTDTR
jgi:hypothetical protein